MEHSKNNSALLTTMENLEKRLKLAYDYTIWQHGGNKGNAREEALIDHLTNTMPNKYGFKSGEVFDKENNNSGQVDIIIYDQLFSPVFSDGTKNILAPIESTYGIISVKSKMGTKELDNAIEGIKKYNSLKRPKNENDAFYITPDTKIEGNGGIKISSSHQQNINCIFAFDTTVSKETIIDKITKAGCIDFLIVSNKIFAIGRSTREVITISQYGKQYSFKESNMAVSIFILMLQKYLSKNHLIAGNNTEALILLLKQGNTFHTGEVCPESGVYRLKDRDCKDNGDCKSKDQRGIPLTKGKKFPPCRNCKGRMIWEFVRRA